MRTVQQPLRILFRSPSNLWIRHMCIPGSNVVKQLHVHDFKALLESEDREKYQIIDVRESDELVASQIKTQNIIHMPMSESYKWTYSYFDKKGLNEKKPTILYCKHGIRSMQVAAYLVREEGFEDISNVVGGICAYNKVDPSVPYY